MDESVARLEDEVFHRANAFRRERDLPPLDRDGFVDRVSREHSARMASGSVSFGHDGFQRRADRVRSQLDIRSISENVSYNNYPRGAAAGRVVDGWIDSPVHRSNLLGAADLTGVGAALRDDGTWFVTQLYVLR